MIRKALAACAVRAVLLPFIHLPYHPSKNPSRQQAFSSFIAHSCRHPFVPSELSPVAHCTVHRPPCPIITGGGSRLQPVPFAGHGQPCRCAKRRYLLKPLGRRVRVASAATVSNRFPRVSSPPPPARFSRRIVCGCGCKNSSRPRPGEPPSWRPGPRPIAATVIPDA